MKTGELFSKKGGVLIYAGFMWLFAVVLSSAMGYLSVYQLVLAYIIVGAIPFIVAKPEILYYLSVVTISVELFFLDVHVRNLMHDSIFIVYILLIAAFVSWIFARMGGVREACPSYKFEPLIGFFILWSTISYLWTEDKGHGAVQLLCLYTSFFAFILSIAIIRDRKSLSIVSWLFIVMGIVNAVLAIWSLHSIYEGEVLYSYQAFTLKTQFNPFGRAVKGHGLLPPPATAFYLNLTIFFAVGKILSSVNNKLRFLLFLIIICMMVGYSTTLAKGSLLGLIGGATFIIMNVAALRKKVFTSFFVLFTVIISCFLLSHIDNLAQTLDFGVSRTISTSEGSASITKRMEFWGIGKELLIRTNGLGTGIGSYKQHNVLWPHAHSIYLSPIFELGFIGFWAWLFILGALMHWILRILKKCNDKYWRGILLGYAGGYISILINGAFDFEYSYTFIWLYMGIGIAILLMIERALGDNEKYVLQPTE